MHEELLRQYQQHIEVLKALRDNLESETNEVVSELDHIDRVSFRVKEAKSFVDKALDPQNDPPYNHPLVEIEDQVAGRIIVFFLQDIEKVHEQLAGTFTTVEREHHRPERDAEFGYESHHLICTIPPHLKPDGWSDYSDMPTTFEIQVRTVFMHAYAEPQHNLGYKGVSDLPKEIRRELAWIAASAWGSDGAYDRVWQWYISREQNRYRN